MTDKFLSNEDIELIINYIRIKKEERQNLLHALELSAQELVEQDTMFQGVDMVLRWIEEAKTKA